MQLLAKPQAPVIPASVRLQQECRLIAAAPRQLAEVLFKVWSERFDMLWASGNGLTPADRLAKLGPLAGEILTASAALCQFMLTMIGNSDPEMKAAIENRLASLPAYTVHENGTVTLN